MPDQPLITAFGKRIRTLRTARGLSQEQLAELTGFHRNNRVLNYTSLEFSMIWI